ncbi:MAG: hypothetical protein C5B52_09140 [Bacteroidetes bacterium]|nr:MAG: hypothetical protein C5B52_09140 [Bacteroidota bacterium]
METSLKIAGALLGILVPYLFIITLNKGIRVSHFDDERKGKFKQILWTLVVIGTIAIWILSISKTLDYHTGDVVPRFAIPLLVIVIMGIWLLGNKYFQTILSSTSLVSLVGVQSFRLAGTAFFLITYLKILPAPFQLAGYGDLFTGMLAIAAANAIHKKSASARGLFWLFNVVGLLDLFNVSILLLVYYPLWNNSAITSEAATKFSLIMIPAIAAPFAILLHIYSIVSAIKPKKEFSF